MAKRCRKFGKVGVLIIAYILAFMSIYGLSLILAVLLQLQKSKQNKRIHVALQLFRRYLWKNKVICIDWLCIKDWLTGRRSKAIGIKRQSPQYPLLIWQESFLLQILWCCFIRRVMQLVSRHWPLSPCRRHWTRAICGPKARVLCIVWFPEESWILGPQWIFIGCSSLWCASEQQEIPQPPFSWRTLCRWGWRRVGRQWSFWIGRCWVFGGFP